MSSVNISKEFLEFMKSEVIGFEIEYKGLTFRKLDISNIEVSGPGVVTFLVRM